MPALIGSSGVFAAWAGVIVATAGLAPFGRPALAATRLNFERGSVVEPVFPPSQGTIQREHFGVGRWSHHDQGSQSYRQSSSARICGRRSVCARNSGINELLRTRVAPDPHAGASKLWRVHRIACKGLSSSYGLPRSAAQMRMPPVTRTTSPVIYDAPAHRYVISSAYSSVRPTRASGTVARAAESMSPNEHSQFEFT